ncbi:hypothetical protein HZS_5276 [Henneguya salminicola]|nr:hypothetical protein HZS_5276 [Henneguya salminicola]
MVKILCRVHESLTVTSFILIISMINLGFLLSSTVLVGWARDYENLNRFGLWRYCSSVDEICHDYQWFQVPEYIDAVRAFMILSCCLAFLLCAYLISMAFTHVRNALTYLRILIAITGNFLPI